MVRFRPGGGWVHQGVRRRYGDIGVRRYYTGAGSTARQLARITSSATVTPPPRPPPAPRAPVRQPPINPSPAPERPVRSPPTPQRAAPPSAPAPSTPAAPAAEALTPTQRFDQARDNIFAPVGTAPTTWTRQDIEALPAG